MRFVQLKIARIPSETQLKLMESVENLYKGCWEGFWGDFGLVVKGMHVHNVVTEFFRTWMKV